MIAAPNSPSTPEKRHRLSVVDVTEKNQAIAERGDIPLQFVAAQKAEFVVAAPQSLGLKNVDNSDRVRLTRIEVRMSS